MGVVEQLEDCFDAIEFEGVVISVQSGEAFEVYVAVEVAAGIVEGIDVTSGDHDLYCFHAGVEWLFLFGYAMVYRSYW